VITLIILLADGEWLQQLYGGLININRKPCRP
jgi:hypothetical protein